MKTRVLVVDDEPVIVDSLTTLLAAEDIESAGAFDRMSAEAMIRGTFYPVVIADVRLHSKDEGLALLDDIKRLSPQSKVISISAYPTPELEKELLGRGSRMLIAKPAEIGEILTAIFDLVGEIEKIADDELDQPDIEQLHDKVRRLLYSIPQRRFGLSPEEAEDVVQEAWLLFLEKRGLIRMEQAWLAGTVTNLCRRHLYSARCSREQAAEDQVLESAADPRSEISEEAIDLLEAIGSLDKKSQLLCRLIAIEGYSYDEVSSATGLPLGSIGPMYIRAKDKLRRELSN